MEITIKIKTSFRNELCLKGISIDEDVNEIRNTGLHDFDSDEELSLKACSLLTKTIKESLKEINSWEWSTRKD